MYEQSKGFHVAETAAVLYLAAPLLIFFASFIRPEVALLSCSLILFLISEIMRQTHGIRRLTPDWQLLYLLCVAVVWVWLSGGIGPVHQNDDWYKHHQIVEVLTTHPWPVVMDLGSTGVVALRYYIGWYLVPSMLLKFTGSGLQVHLIAAWSALGIFILFVLLRSIVPNRQGTIAVPLVFVSFGGADFIGTYLTKIAPLPIYHFEWWVGWIQYSSNTTALFWAPQHAISAWLGMALLMRFGYRAAPIPYLGLLMSATLLWSPFSAIGLAPFLIVAAVRHGIRNVFTDLRLAASTALLALPVGLYLIAGAGRIPHGFIETIPCILDRPCFSWASYPVFLLLEVSLPLGLLLLRKDVDRVILIVAGITLFLIPFYKMGMANDFAMRVSLPSLALLGILCAKVIISGPKFHSIVIAIVLLLALPTAVGEIARGFVTVNSDVSPTANVSPEYRVYHGKFLDQYFARLPVWVLRGARAMPPEDLVYRRASDDVRGDFEN